MKTRIFGYSCIFFSMFPFALHYISQLPNSTLPTLASFISCLVIWFLVTISFNINRKFGVLVSLIIYIIFFTVYISGKEYYLFYQTYPIHESLYLLKEAINSSNNFKIDNKSIVLSLIAFSLIFFMYYVHNKTKNTSVTYISQIVTIFFTLYIYNFISTNTFVVNSLEIKENPSLIASNETPVSAMIKSIPIFGINNNVDKENIENYQLAKDIAAGKKINIPPRANINENNTLFKDWNYGLTLKERNIQQPTKTETYTPSSINKNIILIILESIRTEEITSKNITPNLKKIINESAYYQNFYSTNITTVKSEHAILCGVPELSDQAPYSTKYGEFRGVCLPKKLKDNGYSTLWFHGNTDTFFNRKIFHKSLGFENVLGKEFFIHNGYNIKNDIGWGIPDSYVFSKALEKLEIIEKPFFAEILTLTNHQPFNWEYPNSMPKNIKYSGDDKYKNYLKGIHYSDYSLGIFIEQFKKSKLHENTMLIITGDHGVPLYDAVYSDIDKIEKLYRVPLIIYHKGITPRLNTHTFSHLDIAATVLDILKIKNDIKTLGNSLYGNNSSNQTRPIYLMNMGNYNFKYGETSCYQFDNSCNIQADIQISKNNQIIQDALRGYNYMKIMQIAGYKGNTINE